MLAGSGVVWGLVGLVGLSGFRGPRVCMGKAKKAKWASCLNNVY